MQIELIIELGWTQSLRVARDAGRITFERRWLWGLIRSNLDARIEGEFLAVVVEPNACVCELRNGDDLRVAQGARRDVVGQKLAQFLGIPIETIVGEPFDSSEHDPVHYWLSLAQDRRRARRERERTASGTADPDAPPHR